jgi:hypothetical protein
MAQTIRIKRSTAADSPGTLTAGELAYSGKSTSNKLFIGHPDGSTGVIPIGGQHYTTIIDGAASANTASKLVLRDASGDFAAGLITGNITSTGTSTFTTIDVNGGAIDGTTIGSATPAAGTFTTISTTSTLSTTGNFAVGADKFNVVATSGNTQIDGTLGVDGSFDVDGLVNLNNTTQSTAGNQATGAVIIDGGVGIAKNLNIGGAADIEGALTVGGTITGDLTGAISGNATSATALATARTIAITGDLAYTSPTFDGSANVTAAGTLATVNSNVGGFGSSTAIPVVTVNAKGLVTAVSTAAISSTLDLAADTGTDNGVLIGTDTLTVSGGVGVDTSVTGDTITVTIGQAVATTSDVTFNNVAVDGTLTSDDITATTMTASGHVIVQGNLTVNGTTTTVNSNTVAIGDAIMTLNSDEAGTPSANAGLEIERGTVANVSLLWNETNDNWTVSDGSVTAVVLTASNFNAVYSGEIDGGSSF